jgi:hypothetical protein
MLVALDTTYSDNRDGQVYGGFDVSHRTDAHGNYKLSWLVKPGTPTGPASSQVGVADHEGSGQGKGVFRVALAC